MFTQKNCRLHLSVSVTRAVLVGLGLTVSALTPGVQAGFIRGASGNTAPADAGAASKSVMSVVNFAVLQNEGSIAVPGDTFGSGFRLDNAKFTPGKSPLDPTMNSPAALATKSTYLYLYEVTNDFPNGSPNSIVTVSINLQVPTKDITSYGFFTGVALADEKGTVNGSPTGYFGAKFAGFGTVANPSTAIGGVNDALLVKSAGLVAPSLVVLSPTSITAVFPITGPMPAQGVSQIFGFTTNDAPSIVAVTVSGGNKALTRVEGDVPSPKAASTPEPTSFVLLGTGIVLGVMVSHARGRVRRRSALCGSH